MTDPTTLDTTTARCPRGFTAAGLACGIKVNGKHDLGAIFCPKGAAAAGLFTTNLLRAAPVDVSAANLKRGGGAARVVLVNSGCANAATGAEGMRRAQRMAQAASAAAGCAVNEALIASTGLIGSELPIEKIEEACPTLVKQAASTTSGGASTSGGLPGFARAILTTDASTKMVDATFTHDGRTLHVAGVAKGAGMIHPNMATLIAVILTDAMLSPEALDAMLRRAADRSFHRVSVDGDTSTNDTLFALASGEAGEFPAQLVEDAISRVARELAIKVVSDGEGARKLLHVTARNAIDGAQALRVAQTVASSLLVRTAAAGGDPNWGRIVAAIGRADPRVDLARLTVRAGDVLIWDRGVPVPNVRDAFRRVMTGKTIPIDADLALGDAHDEFFSCDLTQDYVKLNSEYST